MRILRLPQVMLRTGFSKSSIYSKAARGEFPRPVKIGEAASGWIESEIERFLRARVRESREPQKVSA